MFDVALCCEDKLPPLVVCCRFAAGPYGKSKRENQTNNTSGIYVIPKI